MKKADIQPQTVSVVGLLLVFLAGQFTLSAMDIPDFPIRYVLLLFSLTFLFVFLWRNPVVFGASRDVVAFLWLLFLSTVYLMSSILWVKNIDVGIPKFVDVVFLFLMCLILAVAIHACRSRDHVASVVAYFFVMAGLIYLSVILWAAATDPVRGEVYTGGYNVQTRVLFMAVCCSLFLFTRNGERRHIVLSGLFLVSIVLVMSKQGIVAAALVLTLYLVLLVLRKDVHPYKNNPHREKDRRMRATGIRRGLGALAIVSLVFVFLQDRIYRILEYTVTEVSMFYIPLVLVGEDLSTLAAADTRADLAANSIRIIEEHPWWGIGLAGYLDVPDIGFYPHNIALEFVLDGGILAGIFFLMLASYSIYILIKGRKSVYLPLCLVPPYMLIVSFVSGGLYDFRYYFMWTIILLFLLSKQHHRKDKLGMTARQTLNGLHLRDKVGVKS